MIEEKKSTENFSSLNVDIKFAHYIMKTWDKDEIYLRYLFNKIPFKIYFSLLFYWTMSIYYIYKWHLDFIANNESNYLDKHLFLLELSIINGLMTCAYFWNGTLQKTISFFLITLKCGKRSNFSWESIEKCRLFIVMIINLSVKNLCTTCLFSFSLQGVPKVRSESFFVYLCYFI